MMIFRLGGHTLTLHWALVYLVCGWLTFAASYHTQVDPPEPSTRVCVECDRAFVAFVNGATWPLYWSMWR